MVKLFFNWKLTNNYMYLKKNFCEKNSVSQTLIFFFFCTYLFYFFTHIIFSALRSSLRPATLLKKRLWHRCFPVNFAKFLRTTFFIEHLCWLLPYSAQKMTFSVENFYSKCERIHSFLRWVSSLGQRLIRGINLTSAPNHKVTNITIT